ncbi:hypothetical protein [Flavobacterium rhizosphaerae]|uniref:Uncharacterized protein n=1 Tax=Flavobacterium rhizosphaerae TaxID=3163298 RepID=A0ABW8YW32_9FLAO
MNKEPKKNTEDELQGDAYGQDNGAGREASFTTNNTGSEKANTEREHPEDDTDKYLAMEQPGVTFTHDATPALTSDDANFDENNKQGIWNEEGGNPRNSDAFNQDEYILDDNIDVDEDQNKSISTDDDDFEEINERYTS